MKSSLVPRSKNTHTFAIDFKSEIDDRHYQGNFTCKKLTVQDYAALGVRKAQLNGGFHYNPERPGYGVDAETNLFNEWFATLEIVLTQTPDWWKLNEIADMNLVGAVYKEVLSFERTFQGRNRSATAAPGYDGSGEGAGKATSTQSDGSGVLTELVGSEVQSSLEP